MEGVSWLFHSSKQIPKTDQKLYTTLVPNKKKHSSNFVVPKNSLICAVESPIGQKSILLNGTPMYQRVHIFTHTLSFLCCCQKKEETPGGIPFMSEMHKRTVSSCTLTSLYDVTISFAWVPFCYICYSKSLLLSLLNVSYQIDKQTKRKHIFNNNCISCFGFKVYH